jgi:hypothetical protein
MGEQIPQSIHLRRLFITDHDCLVSATPELFPPIMKSSRLAGQVGIEVVHELGELRGVVDA